MNEYKEYTEKDAVECAQTAINYLAEGPRHRGEQYLKQAIIALEWLKDTAENYGARCDNISDEDFNEDTFRDYLEDAVEYAKAEKLIKKAQELFR